MLSLAELQQRLDQPTTGGFGAIGADEGSLVLDGLRIRPRYFDGKFLTAHDLTRDQDYIRQRQNDLAAATGMGVVRGLQVTASGAGMGDRLEITAGHGVTPSGAIVMIGETRSVALLDIAENRRIDAVFGLSSQPSIPLSARTGLFVVALRPVEFSANPMGVYPADVTGQRRQEDGDIIEATAITLIAFEDAGGAPDLESARMLAAQKIFGGTAGALPHDALPLAMLALDRGTIRWLDMPMVRRETGADSPLEVSLGARPRAVSDAFLQQYQNHLAEVMLQRNLRGRGQQFAAAEHFQLLPPAGPMPMEAVIFGRDGLEQAWLPGDHSVQVSFIPADELAAVVDEAIVLPPIDLKAEGSAGLALSVMVPLPRNTLYRLVNSLRDLERPAAAPLRLTGAAPALARLDGVLARRNARLDLLKPVPAPITARPGSILTPEEQAQYDLWQAALDDAAAEVPRDANGLPVVWYVRQRTTPRAQALVGVSVPVTTMPDAIIQPDGPVVSEGLRLRIPPVLLEEQREKQVDDVAATLGLKGRLAALRKAASAGAQSAMGEVLAGGAARDVLFANLVNDLESAAPAVKTDEGRIDQLRQRSKLLDTRLTKRSEEQKLLSKEDVAAISADYLRPDAGAGLEQLGKLTDAGLISGKSGVWLGDTGLGLAVDKLMVAETEAARPETAKAIGELISKQDAKGLGELVTRLSIKR